MTTHNDSTPAWLLLQASLALVWLWLMRGWFDRLAVCLSFLQFKDDPRIAMYHMACKVEEGASDVTFLYKFVRGAASKSHAANVARAAGLPLSIISRAATMSETFERKCVEAMGHNRTQLSIAFPQQKAGAAPSELVLPRATREALQNAIARKEWTTVLKLKQQFELAQQQYAKAEQQEQKQVGMQTG
jgi:DNA mismatch repair ATPase MutS